MKVVRITKTTSGADGFGGRKRFSICEGENEITREQYDLISNYPHIKKKIADGIYIVTLLEE